MNRLTLPASGSTLTGLLAISLWRRGIKDIALGFGLASATLAYFSVFDFLRGRDPEHKQQLYKKRKAAWEESNARPIIGILKQQAARIGGLANLRKPQMGQGLMMQFIQAGEQSLQRQDLATATKYFTYGVDVSYISQGAEAAQKLINTVGSMIPHIVGQIQADFAKDKRAIDRMLAEEDKPLKSRDDIIKSLKEKDLEVDPIDESDEEEEPKQAIIEEIVEEDALEEDPIYDDDEPVVQAAPEPVQATPEAPKADTPPPADEPIVEKVEVEEVVEEPVAEEQVAEEVVEEQVIDEVVEDVAAKSEEKVESENEEAAEPEEEVNSAEEITSAEIVEASELESDSEPEIEQAVTTDNEPVVTEEKVTGEVVNEVIDEKEDPESEEINQHDEGDAPPAITKTTVTAAPVEIEDEELE